jgi:uncharacterized protein
MPWPDPALIAAIVVIATVGALVQGTVGFGLAVFSAPLLTLIEPRMVPGPLLLATFVLTLLIALRDREAIDLAGVKWALVGRVPGILAGAGVLALLAPRLLVVLFGVLIVLGAAMTARGPALEPTRGTLLVAGFVSGFMGTAVAIGGPPVALVYQREEGRRIRGTLNGYFLVGSLFSLAALFAIGRLGADELRCAALLVPGVVLGWAGSASAARWLDSKRRGVRIAVLAVSAASGLIVIGRQLLS